METLVTYANQFVIYTVCYALFFAIYGYIIYNLLKFIFRVAANAYKHIKSDWDAWRAGKKNNEKRGNGYDND